MIASLDSQVDELQGTIEGMNSCFLSLVDTLTSSKWLVNDTQLANQLHTSIKTFLQLVRSSHATNGSFEDRSIPEMREKLPAMSASTVASDVTIFPDHSADEEISNYLHGIGNAVSESWPDSRRQPAQVSKQHVQRKTREPLSKVERSINHMKNYNDLPVVSQKVLSEFYQPSPYLSAFPPGSWQSPEIDGSNFATRLHVAAFKEGYRIACNAERDLNAFQLVFGVQLHSFNTRRNLLSFLERAIHQNFERLLEPPEPSLMDLEGESVGWLNATEVSQYFSEKGLDLDHHPFIAELELDERHLSTDASRNPKMVLQTEASERSQTFDFSSWASFHFRRTDPAQTKSKVRVDVARLINGKFSEMYMIGI
jgi:hypothetical protein